MNLGYANPKALELNKGNFNTPKAVSVIIWRGIDGPLLSNKTQPGQSPTRISSIRFPRMFVAAKTVGDFHHLCDVFLTIGFTDYLNPMFH